jgi:prepilin-type N-terminal cleavage/methylation domain-containing protein
MSVRKLFEKGRKYMRRKTGFTLIELLIVIGVIATILALVMPNMMGMRQRARDVKRKAELGEVKTALRLFYNDYQSYPTNLTDGCNGGACSDGTYDFIVSGNLYMKKWPDMNGTVAGNGWTYSPNGSDDFCIVTILENTGDPDISSSVTRCSAACGANCTVANYNYCMCAD